MRDREGRCGIFDDDILAGAGRLLSDYAQMRSQVSGIGNFARNCYAIRDGAMEGATTLIKAMS